MSQKPEVAEAPIIDLTCPPESLSGSTLGVIATDKDNSSSFSAAAKTSISLADELKHGTSTNVDPKALHPHPINSQIYGEDEDFSQLASLISQDGWIKPLVITPQKRIISGHRRWKAVIQLGLESVPVEVREFPDELAENEALLLENNSRVKTTEQKVREGNAWKNVEASKARLRQRSSLKQGSASPVQANLPEREKGQSRDWVAKRVGLGGGRTYEKAAKVVEMIDEQRSRGNTSYAQALRRVLNEESVDAAYKLVKKLMEEQSKILATLANGQAENIKEAVVLLQQQSRERQGIYKAAKKEVTAIAIEANSKDNAQGSDRVTLQQPQPTGDYEKLLSAIESNKGSFTKEQAEALVKALHKTVTGTGMQLLAIGFPDLAG